MKPKCRWNIHIVVLLCCNLIPRLAALPTPNEPSAKQVIDEDDAVIVESGIESGNLPIGDTDGPGPSILGSLDNIFNSVKQFDTQGCLEKMLCEYMQQEGDVASALLSPTRLAGLGSPPPPAPSPQVNQFGRPPPTRFHPGFQQGVHSNPPFQHPGFQQNSFRPGFSSFPPHPPPPPPQSEGVFGGSFLTDLTNILLGKRRRRGKRQTNIQGNIIRLLQATGMDSLNMFPYVRAALIGHATRSSGANSRPGTLNIRRGSGECSRLYRQCPSDSDALLNYFNNHQGGIVNQVQPSVTNEVAPLVSAIITDAIGEETLDNAGSSVDGGTGIFGDIDKVVTNLLVQGASSYLGGDGSSSATPTAGQGQGDLLSFLPSVDSLTSLFGRRK